MITNYKADILHGRGLAALLHGPLTGGGLLLLTSAVPEDDVNDDVINVLNEPPDAHSDDSDNDDGNDNAPAWIKAVRETAKTM